MSSDRYRMWLALCRCLWISSIGQEVTRIQNVPGSFETLSHRIERVTRLHPSSNASITMTTGPLMWCWLTGIRMSLSNWQDWLAEARLQSFLRIWDMCPARPLLNHTRSHAIVLKSFAGVLLSGIFLSKKNDEPSTPTWKQFWETVCTIALLPAPATSHSQNISAGLISSAEYIHLQIL